MSSGTAGSAGLAAVSPADFCEGSSPQPPANTAPRTKKPAAIPDRNRRIPYRWLRGFLSLPLASARIRAEDAFTLHPEMILVSSIRNLPLSVRCSELRRSDRLFRRVRHFPFVWTVLLFAREAEVRYNNSIRCRPFVEALAFRKFLAGYG